MEKGDTSISALRVEKPQALKYRVLRFFSKLLQCNTALGVEDDVTDT